MDSKTSPTFAADSKTSPTFAADSKTSPTFTDRLESLRVDKENGNIKQLYITRTGVASVPESQIEDRVYHMLLEVHTHIKSPQTQSKK